VSNWRRADGWWRDRAEVALRLCRSVTALADRGVTADQLSVGVLTEEDWVHTPGNWVFFPEWMLVLESKARDAVPLPADAGASRFVRVEYAPGSADDAIVGQAAA
jgi:hypothetical protein